MRSSFVVDEECALSISRPGHALSWPEEVILRTKDHDSRQCNKFHIFMKARVEVCLVSYYFCSAPIANSWRR